MASPDHAAPPTSTSDQSITFTDVSLVLPSSPIPVPNSSLTISTTTGLITAIKPGNGSSSTDDPPATSTTTAISLPSLILAPGLLDLQVNGLAGVHFTRLTPVPFPPPSSLDPTPAHSSDTAAAPNSNDPALTLCATTQARAGVTGWWATIPTVPRERWRGLIAALRPRGFVQTDGAELLGVHCEGPFLEARKRGAHCEGFLVGAGEGAGMGKGHGEEREELEERIYGRENLQGGLIKMVTLAPELEGAVEMVGRLRRKYPWVRVAMGHSMATVEEGRRGVRAGACMVTHTFNAMNGVLGREPGLPGLMVREGGDGGGKEGEEGRVWYSIIGDGVHLHGQVMEMAMQLGADPDGNGGGRCIGITDAIELAGLEDGVYPGNEQIQGRQVKMGNRVTIEGTDTLIGSCVLVDQVVRTLAGVGNGDGASEGGATARWGGLAEEEKGRRLVRALKATSQNIADMMGEEQRGRLVVGRRADLVVLDCAGVVKQTWVGGKKVFDLKT